MNNANQPLFISIEGGEGAGKTTLIDSLKKQLVSWGFSVVTTREPGGTPLGNEIRSWLLNHRQHIAVGPKAELLMFLAARAQHIQEVIAPSIAAGKVVLCDRFNDSTIAYQGVGRGLGKGFVQDLCLTVCGNTIPDLTFFLDIDPQIGLRRTRQAAKENAAAGEVDRIESEELAFHKRVREAFIEIAQEEPDRIVIVDASLPRTEVAAICNKELAVLFKKEG